MLNVTDRRRGNGCAVAIAHATVMSVLGFQHASERVGFLSGSAVLVVIGVALLALAPAKESVGRTSTAVA